MDNSVIALLCVAAVAIAGIYFIVTYCPKKH
jgi:hypothetical protein